MSMRRKEKSEMSFFEHLEALRWHLFRSVLVISAFSIYFLANKNWLFNDIIFAPKDPSFLTYRWFCFLGEKLNMPGLCIDQINYTLILSDMTGGFMLYLRSSFVLGLICAFPYVLYEIWLFIKPALYEKERKNVNGIIFISVILFYVGAAFGYLILAPFSINFLGAFTIGDQVSMTFSAGSFIDILTGMVLWSGVIFEIPMVAYFLAKLGLLGREFMAKNRKFAVVAALFISAVITPSTDIFSQTLVALPLWLLYEASIIVVSRVEKKRNKEIFEN